MHSIVRRMRCEVNSAAALLASVDLPLRLCAVADCSGGCKRGAGEWKLPRRRVMALLVKCSGTNHRIYTNDHHPPSIPLD